MKKNSKKIFIIFALILIVLIGSYFSFFNKNETHKKVSSNNTEYFFPIKLLFVDKSKTSENVKLDDVFTVNDTDKILYADSIYAPIEKENNEYIIYLKKYLNNNLFDTFTDIVFAKYNNRGEVLNDIIYNEKDKTIKIPSSYFNNDNKMPVQCEFVSRMSTSDLKNINVSLTINKKKKNIKLNEYGPTVNLSLKSYSKYRKLTKEDIDIYINDSSKSLPNSAFEYNKKTGLLSFEFYPVFLNNINIKLKNKNFITNFIDNFKVNAAYEYLSGSSTFNLSSAPSGIGLGTYFQFSTTVYEGDSNPNVANSSGSPFRPINHVYSNGSYTVGTSANPLPYDEVWAVLVDSSSDFGFVNGEQHFSIDLPSNISYEGVNINFESDMKIRLNCMHVDLANNIGDSMYTTVGAKVIYYNETERKMSIAFMVEGALLNTQSAWGVYNFTWPEEDFAKLKVKKISYDGVNTVNPEGINIGLYSDDTCSTEITSKTTDSNGEVLFENLKVNTNYYINELEVNDNKWVTSGCKNAYIEKDDANKVSDGNYYYKETTYNNRAKKYCLKVKKVDAEDSSKVISGIKFSLTNGTDTTEGTTGNDGIYTFNYLVKNTNDSSTGYRLHEVSSDGTNGYWNDGATASDYGDQWIGDNQLTEMVYMVNGAASIYSSEPGGSYVCPSDAFTYTKADHKQYYCIKMKKVDKNTKQLIKPATFKNITTNEEHSDGWDGSVDGYTTFFTGDKSGSFTVQETVAPAGYSVFNGTKTSTAFILPRELSRAQAEAECKNIKCTYNINNDTDTCRYTPANSKTDRTNGDVIDGITIGTIPTFPDSKYLLNWYKEYETNGSKANGATFKVKNSSGKYIIVSGTESVADSSNPAKTKTCYRYSGLANDMAGGSSLVSGANNENGGVCISGIDAGTYTVIETSPVPNHTFGSSLTKDITASTVYTDNQIFKNYGTYTEVEKKVTDSNRVSSILDSTVLFKIETNKLKKIPFEIYKTDNNGNATGEAISFVLRDGIYYDLSSPDISLASGETATTTIYLNDNRRFKLSHLAWGKYVAKEKGHKDSGTCVCENEADCIGYYYPRTDQEIKFEITKCSSSNSVSSGVANNTIGSNTCAITYSSVAGYQDNTPTELWFTKKDFYGYEDSSDVASEEVDFVDDKERSDFDRIVFRVKDANGNYLKFIDVGAHITDSNNVCLNDNDYREYRYITDEELSLLSTEERSQLTIVTDLHTCGGHIRITNLCRGKNYTVEEVSVPENSVFILPEKQEDRETVYKVPCCEDNTVTIKTTQTVIVDKGTRVIFEKRDSRYGYLIPDETTTFNVYQCKKGVECHPANGINSDMKLMKFSNRALITGDEEDYGKEVYNAMSDTDVKSGKQFVTDLHPYKGDLILRYLPSGYEYVLLETVAPKNYVLPSGTNAETRFTVVNNTVNVEEVDVPNKPTSLLIRKYDDKGNLLPGAEFKIYKVTSHDENRTAENQEKTLLKLKTIRDGLYDAREVTDTNTIKTCKDNELQKCSDINPTLTYNGYIYTWTNFEENSLNQNKERVEIKEGEALIQYLEYNNYYVIEEVKAPNGYSLPKNSEDRFTIVHIVPESDVIDTEKQFINKPTPFTFYKYDEYNRPLDGGKFKLQKLNDNKKYVDVTVTKEESDGKNFYKVDKNSTNTILETINGEATVYYLEEGQYRILEVEAPSGYELPKKTINVATFFVDNVGNVYGSSIITNKPKTETTTYNPSAKAELIVNVQTGQTRIKYGLIIILILLSISGLIYIQSKKSVKRGKKNEKK